ncbi:glycosyltransferase family 2 protein [bacterium SCSIO 12741]|nr:glycosyltransferase family 2 protein [bacterium SCSIO 12741]
MLSVLIPVYNFEVVDLIKTLVDQCQYVDKPIEILCIDDGSSDEIRKTNQQVAEWPEVTYRDLTENIGRSAIRLLLAESARYDHLLFLDCDVLIHNRNFLKNYLACLEYPVVIGGIFYQDQAPADERLILRWKYGIHREQKSAAERMKIRYSHFVASNLLIEKKVFLNTQPKGKIFGYGHEDTAIGIRLKELHIPLHHIDNAVEHAGLDTSEDFLIKSLSGVENLTRLFRAGLAGRELRILNYYLNLKKWGLAGISRSILGLFLSTMEKNLTGMNPNLIYFDLWKMYHLIRLDQKFSRTTDS